MPFDSAWNGEASFPFLRDICSPIPTTPQFSSANRVAKPMPHKSEFFVSSQKLDFIRVLSSERHIFASYTGLSLKYVPVIISIEDNFRNMSQTYTDLLCSLLQVLLQAFFAHNARQIWSKFLLISSSGHYTE